ncbi:unnamed protein product [Ilex paraguariensis]|uniref:Inhibitor I9 domain-containing protein n=1 Tax=Ilex paraguariensis TaxID=185542 RepID=A0ABC8UJN2_9AQUA
MIDQVGFRTLFEAELSDGLVGAVKQQMNRVSEKVEDGREIQLLARQYHCHLVAQTLIQVRLFDKRTEFLSAIRTDSSFSANNGKVQFTLSAMTLSVPNDHRTYIIHMDKSAMPAPFSTHHSWYMSTISSLSTTDGNALPTHLYTYNHVIDGLSAVLSRSHLGWLEKVSGHLATYEESFGQLHTTHTPEF